MAFAWSRTTPIRKKKGLAFGLVPGVLLLLCALSCLFSGAHAAAFAWEGTTPIRVVDGIAFDLGPQVLSIDAPVDLTYSYSESHEPTLFVLTPDRIPRAFLPACVIGAKAKQFDDGLYAAVELLSQGRKQTLLNGMMEALTEAEPRAVLGVARELGGGFCMAAELQELGKPLREEFLSDEGQSKPISFYSWSKELGAVWQQDRFLQQEYEPVYGLTATMVPLHRALALHPPLMEQYKQHLSFVRNITNPFRHPTLEVPPDPNANQRYARPRIFPPSISPETSLALKLFGGKPIPPDFDLMKELVKSVQEGNVSLKPSSDSGWYDHCVYALEPLLLPEKAEEAPKLKLSERYREELVALFKSLLSLTRESHAKQLDSPLMGCAMSLSIWLYPELTVEPLATYYGRRADAYQFVRDVLTSHFSVSELNSSQRLVLGQPNGKPLLEELDEMIQLFRGLQQLVLHELGFPKRCAGKDYEEVARTWVGSISQDPDVCTDNRMMVPVFYDVEKKKYKVWCVMGYATKKVEISFHEPPQVTMLNPEVEVEVDLKKTEVDYIYAVHAEVYTRRLLSREEFRALCDHHETFSGIKRAVEAL